MKDTYYDNYHGHLPEHLRYILKNSKIPQRIYLAGDSSLDNKYWVNKQHVQPSSQYSDFLSFSVPDVCHWISVEQPDYLCINTAVEESAICDRYKSLLPQDKVIRDNLTGNDILIVSVGGNDIALKPSVATSVSMGSLMLLPLSVIKWNPGYRYFVKLFRDGIQSYILKLCQKSNPKMVIICGVYYPCLSGSGWADKTLKLLNYDQNPDKLQTVIRNIFTDAIKEIKLPFEKVYLPLYQILDSADPRDYVDRVEPSERGGHKIARAIRKIITK